MSETGTYKILLVDDSREIIDANAEYLESKGYAVRAAQTGAAALAELAAGSFDCVVLDVDLPDTDGFTLCRKILEISDTPVMFLSGHDDPEDIRNGEKAGCADYMTKPYSIRELRYRMESIIRGREDDSNPEPGNPNFFIDGRCGMIHAKDMNKLLSPNEFNLFQLFYQNPQTVFSNESIREQAWWDNPPASSKVNWYVENLRRQLEFAVEYTGRINGNAETGYYLTPPGSERNGL